MSSEPGCRIRIALPGEQAPKFASLLQQGFYQPIAGPVAILDFLVALPGFSREYIESEVQTIFHNGVATDSLGSLLYAGDTLALSAAMPGLAGAIFRREGMHASLRCTVEETHDPDRNRAGFVMVKLYNSIGSDRVVDLMLRGVRIAAKGFLGFIERRGDLFRDPLRILHEDRAISTDRLLELVAACEQVELDLFAE